MNIVFAMTYLKFGEYCKIEAKMESLAQRINVFCMEGLKNKQLQKVLKKTIYQGINNLKWKDNFYTFAFSKGIYYKNIEKDKNAFIYCRKT